MDTSIDYKVCIWMNMPSHHQKGFFDALIRAGVNLKVIYYGQLTKQRKEMGWNELELEDWEGELNNTKISKEFVASIGDFIHIVPGCGSIFLIKLVNILIKSKKEWFHWSEPSHIGFRQVFSYLVKKSYARKVNQYSLGALAIGTRAREDFNRWGIKDSKIYLLPYSVSAVCKTKFIDEEIIRFRAKIDIIFICVASLCKRKGTDILLRAFEQLTEESKLSVGLVLVGPEKNHKYRDYVQQSVKLKSKVLFKGIVSNEKIYSVLNKADIFILASRFDGWGMVLNEAASASMPLVATESVGSAHHLIEDNVNGYRVRALDVNALKNAMMNYIRLPNLIDRHGKASKAIFEKWTPDNNAKRFINILAEVSLSRNTNT